MSLEEVDKDNSKSLFLIAKNRDKYPNLVLFCKVCKKPIACFAVEKDTIECMEQTDLIGFAVITDTPRELFQLLANFHSWKFHDSVDKGLSYIG